MTSVSQKIRTNVYLDSEVKAKAQEIFKTYGMGLSDAFNMFLSQAVIERGITFAIKIPNDKTLEAMKEVNNDQALPVSLEEHLEEMKRYGDAHHPKPK